MSFGQQQISRGRMQTLYASANNVIKATGMWADSDEFKTEWLYPEFGVNSTKDLTNAQADHAIDCLQKLIRGDVPMITFGQEQKIRALGELLNMSEASVFDMIKKQTGYRKGLRMLTQQEASSVIVGLQRIFASGDRDLYNKVNKAGARYLRSSAGKEELQLMRTRALAVKSMSSNNQELRIRIMGIFSGKEKAKIVFGEEMVPCPRCGSYEIKAQTPVACEAEDVKGILSEYADMKLTGTDYLKGPCYIMCFDCLHKGPPVDCSGRTATDVDSDPKVWSEMKKLWNQQTIS